MFIGHFAVGFAAKRFAPRLSLGTLMSGALLLDLLWPAFLLLGWEHARIAPGDTVVTPIDLYDYPISHSLVSAAAYAIIVGAVVLLRRGRVREAAVLGACVLSHWVLDFVSHRADMPVLFGGPKLGLGLWNSVWGTIAVEGLLFVLGVVLYLRATRAKNRVGSIALAVLLLLLAAMYAANYFSPPPPSVGMLGFVGMLGWLFVPWCYWIDRNREVTAT